MELTPEAAKYLATCHNEHRVRDRVQTHFGRTVALLEQHGTYLGFPYVRHVRGQLWEIRIDDPTGAYRLFFGIAPGRILAVACGRTKKADRFPPAVYDWAERTVRTYVAALVRHGHPTDRGDR